MSILLITNQGFNTFISNQSIIYSEAKTLINISMIEKWRENQHNILPDDQMFILKLHQLIFFGWPTGYWRLRSYMYRLGLSHPVKYPYKTGPQTPDHIMHYTTNNGVDIALASGSWETLEHHLILKLGLTDMYLGMKTKNSNEKTQSISIDVFSIRCDKWRCASRHFFSILPPLSKLHNFLFDWSTWLGFKTEEISGHLTSQGSLPVVTRARRLLKRAKPWDKTRNPYWHLVKHLLEQIPTKDTRPEVRGSNSKLRKRRREQVFSSWPIFLSVSLQRLQDSPASTTGR